MKKVICAILSLSLILLPCSVFADTATGSAISLDDRLKLAELSGVATPSSAMQLAAAAAAQDVYITGFTYPSNGSPYYEFNGSSVNSHFMAQPTMIGGLATGITQSIAYSAQGIASKIYNYSSYIDNIESYIDGLESSFTTANSRLLTIANKSIASPSDISDAASTIVDAIQNSGVTIPQSLIDDVDSINTKLHNDPDNNFTSNYIWGKRLTGNSNITWSDGRSKINQSWNFGTNSVFANMDYRFQLFSNSMINMLYNIVGGIGSYSLTNNDLSKTALGSNTSIANDIRNIGANLSEPLHRLAFVLANDEDIEARQAALANTETVVDNFIKPSGSASASISDFGSVADIASTGRDSLSSGVDPSVLLNQLGGDGDGWDWFSQHIQDELSAPSGRSSLRSYNKSNSSDTPYLDSYYRDLQEKIGFKIW